MPAVQDLEGHWSNINGRSEFKWTPATSFVRHANVFVVLRSSILVSSWRQEKKIRWTKLSLAIAILVLSQCKEPLASSRRRCWLSYKAVRGFFRRKRVRESVLYPNACLDVLFWRLSKDQPTSVPKYSLSNHDHAVYRHRHSTPEGSFSPAATMWPRTWVVSSPSTGYNTELRRAYVGCFRSRNAHSNVIVHQ